MEGNTSRNADPEGLAVVIPPIWPFAFIIIKPLGAKVHLQASTFAPFVEIQKASYNAKLGKKASFRVEAFYEIEGLLSIWLACKELLSQYAEEQDAKKVALFHKNRQNFSF